MDVVAPNLLKQALTEQRLCGAFCFRDDPIPEYKAVRLGHHLMHAVASPSFINRHFENRLLEEALARAPLLRGGSHDTAPELWTQAIECSPRSLKAHILPSDHSVAKACLTGIGWALCSNLLIGDLLEIGELQELVPDSTVIQPLYWYLSKPFVEVFQPITDALIEAFADIDPT